MNVSKKMAYAMMAVAAVLWGTSGPIAELAYEEGADSMQVAVFASVFTAAILLFAVALFDRKSLIVRRKDLVHFFVFSLVTGTFFTLAWYRCVERTSTATAVILLYMYPSIVTIASIFTLGEKLDKAKVIALPLTFIGCVLVAGARDLEEGGLAFDMLGIGLGVFAAFAAALYYIWGKKFLDSYSANTVVLYLMMLSLPGLLVIANPIDLADTSLSATAWALIFMLGLVPGTIAFVVSLVALNRIEASRASIIASVEPVAAVILAYLLLSDTLNIWQTAGVGMVFVGVILLRLTQEKEPTKPVEAVLER